MRLMVRAIVLAGALLSGCASKLPTPPDIELYNHRAEFQRALCTNVKTGKPCPSVPMEETHKWYMLKPTHMEALQNYIDTLIRELERKMIGYADSMDGRSKLVIGPEDLRLMAKRLREVRRKLTLP